MARVPPSTKQTPPERLPHTATDVAAQIRSALRDGGSSEHASGVQWFFKEEIKSHGWYTGDLRRAVRLCRRQVLQEHDFYFFVKNARELFPRVLLQEKVASVVLLLKME